MMRPTVLSVLCALLLAAPVIATADDEKEKPAPERRGDPAALFKKLDQNQDGKVTASEVGEERQRFFSSLVELGDGDKDGALDLEEFQKALEARRGSADARPRDERPRARDDRAPEPKRLLARFDQNGDGKLTKDEAPPEMAARFDRMLERGDKDGDGALDAGELAALRRDAPPGGPAPRPGSPEGVARPPAPEALFFAVLDADRDGTLDAGEIAAAPAALKALDANGDGALSRRELLRAARRSSDRRDRADGAPGRGAAGLFRRLDADGDGSVSREEAKGRVKARFDRLDADGNGVLSLAELQASPPVRKKPEAGDAPDRPKEKEKERDRRAKDKEADRKSDKESDKDVEKKGETVS